MTVTAGGISCSSSSVLVLKGHLQFFDDDQIALHRQKCAISVMADLEQSLAIWIAGVTICNLVPFFCLSFAPILTLVTWYLLVWLYFCARCMSQSRVLCGYREMYILEGNFYKIWDPGAKKFNMDMGYLIQFSAVGVYILKCVIYYIRTVHWQTSCLLYI